MEPSIQQLSASRRVPPQNLEAEQCVLGSILLQQGILVRAVEFLTPDDFYRDAHKAIYAAMLGLFDKGEPQDIITVTNHLKDSGHLEGAGGPAYLATLTNIVPVASNIAFYAKIVRAKSILRRLISTTTVGMASVSISRRST